MGKSICTRCCAAVVVSILVSGCGNFLGNVGEQMTDQPAKEREQARSDAARQAPARPR